MKSGTIAVGSALALLLAAGFAEPAAAKIQVVNFTITGGGWFGTTPPYGLPPQPTLTGSVHVDDTKTGNAAFIGLNYKTGSRIWTLADIISGAFGGDGVTYDAFGVVNNITLEMGSVGSETYVISNNTAGIDFPLMSPFDGTGIACNGCVSLSVPGVPEPATWTLFILGFGWLGTAMRRRHTKVVVKPA